MIARIRRFLLLLGVALLTVGMVGCGWFRRSSDAEMTPPTSVANAQPTRPSSEPTPVIGSNLFADGIAATVNGKVIPRSEVRDAILRERFLLEQQVLSPAEKKRRIQKLEKEGLDAMIERELILSEYDKRGFPVKEQDVDAQVNHIIRQRFGGNRDQFVNALRQTGITMRKFREDQVKVIKVLRMKNAIARDKTRPPSPKEVEAYYQKHINDYRDEGEIHVWTITVSKRPRDPLSTPKSQRLLAQDLQYQVKRGTKLTELAQKYARNPAARVDDRGFINKTTLQPLLTINAFNLDAGEVSEVIEDNRNYYIIKAVARRYGKAQPLSEVREDIENNITGGQKEAIVDKWVAGLRERALIKRY